jgi:DNA-binding helix-hairpin-helix protein with protein kinase domain
MEGTHPFAGVFEGSGDPPPIAARIVAGHFPYGARRAPYHPAPATLPFDVVPPTIQQLFLRCFEDGHNNPSARPDAQTWQLALNEAEKALSTRAVNEQHRYSSHLHTCPWCERKTRLQGFDPFPSREAVPRGEHLRPVTPKRTPRPVPPPPRPTPAPSRPTQP